MPKMGGATPDCGSVQEPLVLTLKDVKPAAGSSVPNLNIVQSFIAQGKLPFVAGMLLPHAIAATLVLVPFHARGARIMVISNEHPEALERMAPDAELETRVRKAAGVVTSAHVGGTCVQMMEGTFRLAGAG